MATMNTPLDPYRLWQTTLGKPADALERPRAILRESFLSFRSRVADLVSTIGSELPGLTVHDITHLDALWRVADQIIGEAYPLNEAEAYVLGGAFLLHDAAHAVAAYPGRMSEIRRTVEWEDLISQRYEGQDPTPGSSNERTAIFQVLRLLHAKQAQKLPFLEWKASAEMPSMSLIENLDVRNYYADVIGEVAASHHWSPQKVASQFRSHMISCPAFLAPANWEVDALKVALILRTADAAHLDGSRAPWFLFALHQPEGISAEHWKFQAKLGQPTRTATGELRLSSGSAFKPEERRAWWLAFETAKMVDRELRAAYDILRDEGRKAFATVRVQGAESSEAFGQSVRVNGWEPIDVSPKVGNLPKLIATLGGSGLYGDDLSVPLRELLQNGSDAISALQALNGIGRNEGKIAVVVRRVSDDDWLLSVTDNGIGMGRHVLTNVLLDFGASLWSTDELREEHPGLSRAKFSPIGKFGIGFFSIFMLGDEVRVSTKRYQPSSDDKGVHWELRFDNGLSTRPALLTPQPADQLRQHGTRIEVRISNAKFKSILESRTRGSVFNIPGFSSIFDSPQNQKSEKEIEIDLGNSFACVISRLTPASSVDITTKVGNGPIYSAVTANDWPTIDDNILHSRASSSEAPVFELSDETGQLIGRVGLPKGDSFGESACIFYNGIASGRVTGLVGLVQASGNNSDAARATAIPAGDIATWTRWAHAVLGGIPKLHRFQYLSLHPLLVEHDFPVWTFANKQLTLSALEKRIAELDEILVHEGRITHEDSDDVGSSSFSHYFTAVHALICIPNYRHNSKGWLSISFNGNSTSHCEFPWFTGAQPIDYESRLIQSLNRAWGKFELSEEGDAVVGDVNGVEIERSVCIYRRTS